VDRFVLSDSAANGGFPEPLATEPVRVIAARHEACGEATRVRLPRAVPARAVRRVRCAGCQQAFETERVEEVQQQEYVFGTEPVAEAAAAPVATAGGTRRPSLPKLSLPALSLPSLSLPRPKLPDLPARASLPKFDPESPAWRIASIGLAAAAVIGVLLLIQGGGDEPSAPAAPAEPSAAAATEAATGEPATPPASTPPPSQNTELVRGSSYSLALPAGWEQVDASGGATFSAVAPDGTADVTVWIDEDPKLDFPQFVNQSLAQLKAFAGSAEVVERIPAPTPEATVVRLAADAPAGQPTYEVTLRVAGPYRYYLATSVMPDAPAATVEGAELIAGSFTPEVKD
jgi:hypothetical protein